MLLTLLLGDKPGGTRWKVDTMVYGIPSHLFVTKQQSCFYTVYWEIIEVQNFRGLVILKFFVNKFSRMAEMVTCTHFNFGA